MRTLKMLGIVLLLCHYTSYAQDAATAPKTSYAPLTLENVADALKMLKTDVFNIELPVVGPKKYQLVIYMDEYARDTLLNHKELGVGEDIGEGTRTGAKGILTMIFQKKNDSAFYAVTKTKDGERQSILKKNPKYTLDHMFKPFKPQVLVPGKKLPVLLYGSMWHDPKLPANMVRFCMERFLDTDFSSEAFQNMPHHYIFSVELKEL